MHKVGEFHHTEEAKIQISKKMTGRKLSQETKDKIGNANSGRESPRRGKHLPEEHRKNLSITKFGKLNPQWKGGQYRDKFGYILIYAPQHPLAKNNYVYEHRFVMEKKLKRLLTIKERVHHINGNKSDNRIKNLKLFANMGLHTAFHHKLRREERLPSPSLQ